jgi:hypothetical protein
LRPPFDVPTVQRVSGVILARQRLSKMDNKIGVDTGGPVIGGNRNYAGAGVHAPN